MSHLLEPRPLLSSICRFVCASLSLLTFITNYSAAANVAPEQQLRSSYFVVLVFLLGLADTAFAYLLEKNLWITKLGKFITMFCFLALLWGFVAGLFVAIYPTEVPYLVRVSVIGCSLTVFLATVTELNYYVMCRVGLVATPGENEPTSPQFYRPKGSFTKPKNIKMS